MLCTFTIKSDHDDEPRTLVIRTEDIRAILDTSGGNASLVYLMGDDPQQTFITGTARENKDRLQREELDTIATMYAHQQQQQQRVQAGLPIPPVGRGKAGK